MSIYKNNFPPNFSQFSFLINKKKLTTTETGGFAPEVGKIDVKIRIVHKGEVHRARFMPQKDNIIATKSPNSEVFIFNSQTYPSEPKDNTFKPTLTLSGHKDEG